MAKQVSSSLIKKYLELIKRALKRIDSGYYKLETTYEPSGIVRERVFCYELYHQIRRGMKRHHKLSLNGEIDKRGHVKFPLGDRKNPDFVFHIPGKHEGNTLVIEVKGNLRRGCQIYEDFRKILMFIKKYKYKAGVFILYNHSFGELDDKVGKGLKGFKGLRLLARHPNADSVFILCVKEPRKDCEEHVLVELRGRCRAVPTRKIVAQQVTPVYPGTCSIKA